MPKALTAPDYQTSGMPPADRPAAVNEAAPEHIRDAGRHRTAPA